MDMGTIGATVGALIALAAIIFIVVFLAICFRIVVPTNMVHITQSRKQTISYGTGQENGNVYYRWPSWVPYFGITTIELPVSNFDLSLAGYEAYDKDRVPFTVDVVAFFRVNDTQMAAQRVESLKELIDQLHQVVQGAVRKVLASDVIDNIMLKRAEFGQAFTQEVQEQLKEWGVEPVKAMELMDIRDSKEQRNIHNIMAKKTSHIEMESRTEVAKNIQAAQTAEIVAKREVDIEAQMAERLVGERTADKDKAIGIANQQAKQEILTQEKVTQERTMAVERVNEVTQAEIIRDKQVVVADQDKQTQIIRADGELEAERRKAAAIEVVGRAEGEAIKAKQLAPVEAQIVLAKEIGANPGYQSYLAQIESIKAYLVVGSKQAEALQVADIKIIATTGSPAAGLNSVGDLFSSEGGKRVATLLEAFAGSPLGKAALGQLGIKADEPPAEQKEV
jgi:flotillin